MNKSNPPFIPAAPRVTLKLKTAARKSPRESKTSPIASAQSTGKLKPGAQWADDYKESMQRDMDALAR